MYDPLLLQETGMDAEFNFIFHVVGWDSFWNIAEHGSRLFTLEFYAHCKSPTVESNLDFFRKEYSSPKDLSLLLGFNLQCVVDVDHALQDFDKLKFCKEISGIMNFIVPILMTFNIPHFVSCTNG